jgi:hypothetical protein
LEQTASALKDAQEALTTTSSSAELAIDQWESRCSELELRVAGLQSEVKRLESLVQERDNDLKEARDAAQFQHTNEMSERAVALASDALSKHVEDLRSSLQVTQQDYMDAHEVERLRDDLSALLGMPNTPETQAEVHRQAIQLKEDFRRKERQELIELKDALARALDRLESSHEDLLRAEERISSVSLQATIYEQELVTIKGDYNLLTKTLEERRESESSQRESLEYRITGLYNENEILRKQHATVVGNLQNELSQALMERDRLLKALKDKEGELSKATSSSFLDTRHPNTMVVSGGSQSDLQAEVHRLRLERNHLLTAVADEAAAVERRIRQARLAAQSQAEADAIVERDLRLMAAEQMVQDLQRELEQQQPSSRRNPSQQPAAFHGHVAAMDHANIVSEDDAQEELRVEIQVLHDQNVSLREDIVNLEQELQACQDAALEQVGRLREDLRMAKTRNVQAERSVRQEAEFHKELGRLRQHDDDKVVEADNPAMDHHNGGKRDESMDVLVRQYYDETMKLTDQIAQDRQLYGKLADENELLLSLLAKQNLLRQTVQAALEQVGGPDAIREALQAASERAKTELKVVVDFTSAADLD